MSNSVVAIGPFCGSLEYELFHFLPWVNRLSENLIYDKLYIASHYNRQCLYKDFNFYNIPTSYSKDEINQKRFIHSQLKYSTLQEIIKDFKSYITTQENCTSKDINHQSLMYTKVQFQIPLFNKIFKKIKIENEDSIYRGSIVYFPHKIITESASRVILDKIKEFDKKYFVVGDMKTYLIDENNLFKKSDYYTTILSECIEAITEADYVICPISHWALLANLLGKKLFTWGPTASQFKENQIYNFNNKNCMALVTDKKTPIEAISKMLEYHYKKRR